MIITKRIIVTDTNIITDLNTARVLDRFINLDNVYISDLVKLHEINFKTGNLKLINKFKVISSTSQELIEIFDIQNTNKKLSDKDILNYIIARDNKGILATGDERLKKYAETNGVEVIRTLKIIELLYVNSIISYKDFVNGCVFLKNDPKTRIPIDKIDILLNKYNLVKN